MGRRFSTDYLRERLREKDITSLYNVVTSSSAHDRCRDRDGLPEALFLFVRVWEWWGAARSGVWQFYESLDAGTAHAIVEAMRRAGWSDVQDQFERGLKHWQQEHVAGAVDDWLDENDGRLRDLIAALLDREFAALDVVS